MTYAVVSDVEARLGRSISDPLEMGQVEAWLDDVEDIIAARFTRYGLVLATQVTAGDPTEATVIRIEAEAVIRRIQNPVTGLTSVTRSVDDASITERREGGDVGWLTEADWEALLPTFESAAFSTRPGFETDTDLDLLQQWL